MDLCFRSLEIIFQCILVEKIPLVVNAGSGREDFYYYCKHFSSNFKFIRIFSTIKSFSVR